MSLTSEQLKGQLEAAVASSSEDVLAVSVKEAVEAIAEQPDFQAIASMAISFPAVKSNGQHYRRIVGAAKRRITLEKDAKAFVRMLERSLEDAEEVEVEVHTGKQLTEKPPDRSWIVDEWIPLGRVVLFTGQGEVGKSRLALQLAEAVASTHRMWVPGVREFSNLLKSDDYAEGLRVAGEEPANVVVASWEDEPDEIKRRLQGVMRWPEASPPDYDKIHILNMIGKGALWQPGGDDPTASRHTSVMGGPTELAHKLRAYCEAKDARLLVIDTLAAAYVCNENDRGLVRQFMSDLDKWAIQHDCTVLIVAHPPKSRGNNEDATYSGSTDWHGASRAMITLAKAETHDSKMARKKVTDGNVGAPRDERKKAPAPQTALCLSLTKSNYGWAGKTTWLGRDNGMMVSMEPKAAAANAQNLSIRAGTKGSGPPAAPKASIATREPDWVEEEADALFDPD